MKKNLFSDKGKFFKANLHMHTTISDGGLTPQEVKQKYMEHGYSIVAFTDHEIMVPHNELSDENFLAITATELSSNMPCPERNFVFTKCYHVNLYSKDRNRSDFPGFKREYIWLKNTLDYVTDDMKENPEVRVYNQDAVNTILAHAKEQGFLACLNHPIWSLQDYTDIHKLKNLWGVEVFNYGCYISGNEDTTFAFDNLLRLGQLVVPIASDDSHSPVDRDCFGGWSMIKAKSLDYDEVFSALEKGDMYASNGPEFYDIYIEDGILTVHCSPVRQIVVNTERRKAFCKNKFDNEGELITKMQFDLNAYIDLCKEKKDVITKTPYIRIRVEDDMGRHAWTRPYTLNEIVD